MQNSPASNIEPRFSRLMALLAEWQACWRPAPFMFRRVPWLDEHPRLGVTLAELSDADVERLQANPWVDSPLAAWFPVEELAELVRLPLLGDGAVALPAAWGQHVAGRKWQQIEAFLGCVQMAPQEHLLEWCAGKGHLARAMARLGEQSVIALEWQAGLCAEGRRLAAGQDACVHMQQQDVMAAGATGYLSPETHAVALHACGDLHLRLLELAVAAGSAVTLAPCCYHRTRHEVYQAASRRGRELCRYHSLRLERSDLALAVQETVTAPRGVRRHRERANAWRLGFDELQRELGGTDRYLPVPSLAYGQMPDTFAGFCRWAAQQKGVVLPATVDFQAYEQAGWQRQAEVKRLELVRHLFRRPLEVWLALDRLARLQEAGYQAELGTFCASQLTPRDIIIRGRKA